MYLKTESVNRFSYYRLKSCWVHSLFVDVAAAFAIVAATAAASAEAIARPPSGAVLGGMADASAGGAHDVVGDVGSVLALPTLVVISSAVAASRT